MKKCLVNYYPGDLRNLLLERAEKAGRYLGEKIDY